jgi:tetratricopeptide (TPR) repeat protein
LAHRVARLALIAGLAFTSGCRKPPPSTGAVSSAGSSGAAAAQTPAPASVADNQSVAPVKGTTDGNIAANNLNAQIGAAERLLGRQQNDFAMTSLVPLLEARAQFLGRVEDYDRAAKYADDLVGKAPRDGNAYLARAGVRSSLHLFQLALADLDEAQKLKHQPGKVEPARAMTLHAMGRAKEALTLQRVLVEHDPSMGNLGALAVMLGDQGKRDEADALFEKAISAYRDVSPFPVAWIEFQRGQMWERAGQTTKARGFYEAAVARLPGYATAEAHLAGLQAAQGDREGAIVRLRQVVRSSSDPEFAGQLAALLDETGHADEGLLFKERARSGFEALLSRHPEAFSDHAARFFLGAGADPKRALELAQVNLANRTTPEAFDLALTAALEAKDSAAACAVAERARSTLSPLPTPHLEFLVGKADEACGRAAKH